jgi:hypothetical protein
MKEAWYESSVVSWVTSVGCDCVVNRDVSIHHATNRDVAVIRGVAERDVIRGDKTNLPPEPRSAGWR